MDRYNLALIDFHRRWEPFGGPPNSEIFAEFGLTVNQFYARYRALSRVRKFAPASPPRTRRKGAQSKSFLRVGI